MTGLRRLLIACHQLTLLGANLIHRKDPLSDPSDCTTQKEDIMFTKLLSRIQQRARCMADMMARLHIDPVDASRVRSGAGLAAAWRRCLACGSGKDCAAWLDNAPQANGEAPPFCPNSGFLSETCVRPASWPKVSPHFVGDGSSGAKRA